MSIPKNTENDYRYWYMVSDMIDQCIDIALNLSQSGHPGGSRSKVYPMVATLLSGLMRWDIRYPEKRFADRFVLIAGHANPVIYATLAVLNEALRRKYNQTKDSKFLNPKGEKFTLLPEDLLTLRRRGGLPGHAEMEGKTLFFKFNTGPSGHGFPAAVGEAMALKYAGYDDVKVFAIEGEGGLTTGVTHESKNSAFGLGLGNLVLMVDWNDFGIDARPFSDIVAGTPDDWFKPYGWKVRGVERSEEYGDIMKNYEDLLSGNEKNTPKTIWFKTRKGRGYGKFDYKSHGAPHSRNSELFWYTKAEFADKYGVKFQYLNEPAFDTYEENKKQMADCLETVFSLFEKEEGLLDYVASRLVDIGESVPTEEKGQNVFEKNPLLDEELLDYKKYPENIFIPAGEKAPNRKGLANFGAWVNSWSVAKFGRPLFLVSSADLAESTNIAGFSQGYDGKEGLGMYNKEKNPKGTLLPQGITEFANAGISCGISAVNFSEKPFEDWKGFITATSTYGSFSYLLYGAYRLYSQMNQDSQIKLGPTIFVAGHSGPETAEDSRTHFGIYEPSVMKFFPDGQVVNLHPWEPNEVPVMLAEALRLKFPVITLHLTRPSVLIPDRETLGMASYFEAAKGAYLIKPYDESKPKDGVVLVRGTVVIEETLKILDELKGLNVKIVAALSSELFRRQTKKYQDLIFPEKEILDCMIITSSGIRTMEDWASHPVVTEYSLSPDFDNRWRTGGSVEEIYDESHLSAKYQIEAIKRFVREKDIRRGRT